MDRTEYARLVANNIQYLLSVNGKTQSDLAHDLKISKATISSWCNGTRIPRPEGIDALCEYFHVRRTDIMEDKAKSYTRTIPSGVRIPVLGKVAAGRPIEALENVIDWEELPEEMSRKGEYFGLVVKGDSMEPRIYEGDVIIVKKQEDAESGQTVVITINGDDATCKRLEKHSGGLSLYSLNPKYTPFTYTAEEAAKLPIRIYGIVVEIRGKMKGM